MRSNEQYSFFNEQECSQGARAVISGLQWEEHIFSIIEGHRWLYGYSLARQEFEGRKSCGIRLKLDIVVRQDERAVGIECKRQNVSGTADEKLKTTALELRMARLPVMIVAGGCGFRRNVLDEVHRMRSGNFIGLYNETMFFDVLLTALQNAPAQPAPPMESYFNGKR